MTNPLPILWIDDEDPMDRFSRTIKMLTKLDCPVTWAASINEAIERLSSSTVFFPLAILDQLMPFENLHQNPKGGTEWGGCFLLHWLKNKKEVWETSYVRASGLSWEMLSPRMPRHGNETQLSKIIIASGIDNREISKAIRNLDPKIKFFAKPLNEHFLEKEIEDLREKLEVIQ